MRTFKNYLLLGLIGSGLTFSSCGDDDAPGEELEEEEIDQVVLTFTNADGNELKFEANATDTEDFDLDVINLNAGATYTLTIELFNTVEGENVTEEIRDEAPDEHQFFFAWTEGVFSEPSGTGNISPATTDTNDTVVGATGGDVEYKDLDNNQLPIGLETDWTTAPAATSNGRFRVVLKHQPGVKSATTTSNDDGSDIDITWTININE